MTVTVSEIQNALKQVSSGNVSENTHISVYEKCAQLCQKYSLTATSMADEFEAYFSTINDNSFSLAAIGKIEQSLQKKVSSKRSLPFSSPNGDKMQKSSSSSSSQSKVSFAAKLQLTPSSSHSQTPTGISYDERINRGQTVASLNNQLGSRGSFDPSTHKPLGFRCKINCDNFDNITSRYRYMFTTIDERARALEKQLIRIQVQLCEMINLPQSDLQPLGHASQENVWVCGRICCDTAQGKINKKSIHLEGSRREGGRRILLNLDEITSYSLFPGQIVLVEGISSTGREMTAKRLITDVKPIKPITTPKQLLEYHHTKTYQAGGPLSVIVAAGPFTTVDNLEYKALDDLLLLVLDKKPDVLILIGPFIDSSQPLLAKGDSKIMIGDTETIASYEMLFISKIVANGLNVLFDEELGGDANIPTNVIMIPSLLDAHHENVFPQPPYGDRDMIDTSFYAEQLGVLNVPFSNDKDPRKRVHLLPNPSMFSVNETVFGVTSNDVLLSMSSEEISNSTDGNRLGRLAGHLIAQQSFAPQFPPADKCLAQMDFRQMKHWQMRVAPDILITPSKLAPLCKDVNGTLVINPGTITKNSSGGTYAELNIHPMEEKMIRDAIIDNVTALEHSTSSRTLASIARI